MTTINFSGSPVLNQRHSFATKTSTGLTLPGLADGMRLYMAIRKDI